MPEIRRPEWDARNEEHIARHGVRRVEVEEVLQNGPFVTRAGRRRYRAIGVTDAGRYLTVFLDRRLRDAYYVLTARDANEAERRRHRAMHRS